MCLGDADKSWRFIYEVAEREEGIAPERRYTADKEARYDKKHIALPCTIEDKRGIMYTDVAAFPEWDPVTSI